jgi:hypothetical protein
MAAQVLNSSAQQMSVVVHGPLVLDLLELRTRRTGPNSALRAS